MEIERNDFDLGAAWLRRAHGDMHAFTDALATRLELALPHAVKVERRRAGLFSSTTHVARMTVAVEAGLLTLALDHGRLHATRSRIVRGVTIGSTDLTVPAWLEAVLEAVKASSHEAGAAHGALHDFLMS